MLMAFANWLSNTSISMAIQDAYWVIPTIQSVHILAISAVMASVVMLDFRLLGVTSRGQTLSQTAHRFLPWIWGSVCVLFCSGSLLIVGEPPREFSSEVFWTKMSLLACVLILTGAFQYVLKNGGGFWERHRLAARVTAIVSLMLWVSILAAGRWIAYMAHD